MSLKKAKNVIDGLTFFHKDFLCDYDGKEFLLLTKNTKVLELLSKIDVKFESP
jgi:hypothetical protein